MKLHPVASGLLLLGLATPVAADSLFVANNGVDGPTCGGKTEPCRTITAALANAADDDTIVVGPGRYGDLDADGVLGEAEEEAPTGCACAVRVTKRLVIVSRSGAEATVIEGGGVANAVEVDAADAVFGAPGRGFTLRGAGTAGVRVQANRVRIAGNIAVANGTFGFRVDSSDVELAGNTAAGNAGSGFFAATGSDDSRFLGNRSLGNETGFLILDSSITLSGNVAAANEGNGVHLAGFGHHFVGNVVHGNGENGLFVQAGTSGQVIQGNSIVGNGEAGIRTLGPAAEISGNNIFGNDPEDNCGLLNQSDAAVPAPANFWGAATGPGANPADLACNEGASTTNVEPPASKERKIKLKPPK